MSLTFADRQKSRLHFVILTCCLSLNSQTALFVFTFNRSLIILYLPSIRILIY